MLDPTAPVLIDTSCWIEALRRNGAESVRRRVVELTESGRARFADIVRLELWNGARGKELQQFLSGLETIAVPTVPTTEEVWRQARGLARQARAAGVTVQAADLLLFACARVHNLELYSCDGHFELLASLP